MNRFGRNKEPTSELTLKVLKALKVLKLAMALETFARQSLAQFIIIYGEIFDDKAIKPSELESLMWGRMCAKEAGIVKTGFKIPFDNIKRAKVTLPYMPNDITYTGCCAIKKNGGLYTPCCGKVAEDAYYCKTCSVDKEGEAKELEFGSIDTRETNIDDERFAPITFGEWMKGHKTTLTEVYSKLAAAGIALEVPAEELVCRTLPKTRRGRPSKSDEEVSDEDSVPKAPKKKPTPKAKAKSPAASEDEAPKKKAPKAKEPEPESESESEEPKKVSPKPSPKASPKPSPKASPKASPAASEDESPKKPKKVTKLKAESDSESEVEKSKKVSPKPSPKASPKASPAVSEDEAPKKKAKAEKPEKKAKESKTEKAEKPEKKAKEPKVEKAKAEKPKEKAEKPKKVKVPEPEPEPELDVDALAAAFEQEEPEEDEVETCEVDGVDYDLRNSKYICSKDDGTILGTIDDEGDVVWNSDKR